MRVYCIAGEIGVMRREDDYVFKSARERVWRSEAAEQVSTSQA